MKKKLEKQIDQMMEMTLKAISQNENLIQSLNVLYHYAPEDQEYRLFLLNDIAHSYIQDLMDYDSQFHNCSFEQGVKTCIDQKILFFQEKYTTCTMEFIFENVKRTLVFPKTIPLSDMTYLLMSSIDLPFGYDFMISCDGIDYTMDEMRTCSIADLCLEKEEGFLLAFVDSNTNEFIPFQAKLIDEKLYDCDISLDQIQVLQTRNDGLWVEEDEHRTLIQQNEELIPGYIINKMYYERPDLFDEFENGADIEKLLLQMLEDEQDDDLYHPSLLN